MVILRLNATELITDVENVYNQSGGDIQREIEESNPNPGDVIKNSVSLFHPKLRQFRASPWAKVPAILFLLDMLSMDRSIDSSLPQYDMIFYLDSDAAMTPVLQVPPLCSFSL